MVSSGRQLAGERIQAEKPLGFRPLYRQVRDLLVQRIADGVWQGGEVLPAEPEIAADLGVSQGTVRKALDEMAVENLLVRRQGRGTYVACHGEDRILFQFFKLVPDSRARAFPESQILDVDVGPADTRAAAVLGLRAGAHVVRIQRLRSLAGHVCIFETIRLPKALFPGIEKRDLPNNLYELYRAEFGVTIVNATEKLKAVAAPRSVARHLGIEPGTPLLAIDRAAIAIDGRVVEWRMSLCLTEKAHYFSDLK
jgi:GntR family transcriptional regulator